MLTVFSFIYRNYSGRSTMALPLTGDWRVVYPPPNATEKYLFLLDSDSVIFYGADHGTGHGHSGPEHHGCRDRVDPQSDGGAF